MAYGISTSFIVENAIEKCDADYPFFMYRVKCSFDKVIDGNIVHITDGYGCANSNEKQCGRASKFDVANARLKIAKKRALVDGALLIGQLSNMFSQDIENEDFMDKSSKITTVGGDDDQITAKQIKRIYALASSSGISTATAKKIISEAGYASTTEIKQKDYDAVCALFARKEKEQDAN